jgi:hypothetical protein
MTTATARAPRHPRKTTPARHVTTRGTGLAARATGGDRQAWNELAERYAPLIWSTCRTYRLGRADADDAGQSVWLRPGRPRSAHCTASQ